METGPNQNRMCVIGLTRAALSTGHFIVIQELLFQMATGCTGIWQFAHGAGELPRT
jgi:hypothetical protein